MRPDRTPRRRTLSVGAGLLAHGSRLRVRPSQRPKTSVTRNGPSARRSQLRGQRRHHTGFPLSSASPGSDAQNLDRLMRRALDAEVKKHIRISLCVRAPVLMALIFGRGLMAALGGGKSMSAVGVVQVNIRSAQPHRNVLASFLTKRSDNGACSVGAIVALNGCDDDVVREGRGLASLRLGQRRSILVQFGHIGEGSYSRRHATGGR